MAFSKVLPRTGRSGVSGAQKHLLIKYTLEKATASHSTPVFLPGESHGQRILAGYSPGHRKESDATERLDTTSNTRMVCSRLSE